MRREKGKKRQINERVQKQGAPVFTQNTFFSRIKLMHLARFLLGTTIGVPIRVSQSREPLVGYIKIVRYCYLFVGQTESSREWLPPFCRVDRIRQTYAARSTSRPRYTSRDVDTASYPTTYIAHTVRLSAPFASSRNADSLSSEPHIIIHDDLVHHRS